MAVQFHTAQEIGDHSQNIYQDREDARSRFL